MDCQIIQTSNADVQSFYQGSVLRTHIWVSLTSFLSQCSLSVQGLSCHYVHIAMRALLTRSVILLSAEHKSTEVGSQMKAEHTNVTYLHSMVRKLVQICVRDVGSFLVMCCPLRKTYLCSVAGRMFVAVWLRLRHFYKCKFMKMKKKS